jgi:hypothetical protein
MKVHGNRVGLAGHVAQCERLREHLGEYVHSPREWRFYYG